MKIVVRDDALPLRDLVEAFLAAHHEQGKTEASSAEMTLLDPLTGHLYDLCLILTAKDASSDQVTAQLKGLVYCLCQNSLPMPTADGTQA